MRFITFLLSLASATKTDHCKHLCEHDGPSVCTSGSTIIANDVCQGYLFRGDPENSDYCFFSPMTMASCPSSGIPVTATDAKRLLKEKYGIEYESSTTVRPSEFDEDDLMDGDDFSHVTEFRTIFEKKFIRTWYSKYPRPETTLIVNRESALFDSLDFLSGGIARLMGLVNVSFTLESLGPVESYNSWRAEIVKQVFSPESGYFVNSSSSGSSFLNINPSGMEFAKAAEVYRAVGRLLAVSILRNEPLGVSLPVAFFVKLLEKEPRIRDFSQDDPAVAEYLDRIMKASSPDELLTLPVILDDLWHIPTLENREELVRRKIAAYFPESVNFPLHLIRSGFGEMLGLHDVQILLLPAELKLLIKGDSTFLIEDFLAICRFRMPLIQHRIWLTNILRSFNNEEQQKFLHVLTNFDHLPFGGFGQLKFRPTIIDGPDLEIKVDRERHLIIFPRYSTESQLRELILRIIQSS